MRWAVFSDVHGNLPALERVLAHAKGEVDAYLCLGDVVNYGPWSDECVALVRTLPGIQYLEGNHERMYLGLESAPEQSLVRLFTEHTKSWFRSFDAIAGLPESVEVAGFLAIHTIDGRRVYANTEIEVERDYLIGHSHHQFQTLRSGHTIVNCGSVGQNRKVLREANYAIVGDDGSVELRMLEYDTSPVFAEMIARNYPPQCIDYYKSKT